MKTFELSERSISLKKQILNGRNCSKGHELLLNEALWVHDRPIEIRTILSRDGLSVKSKRSGLQRITRFAGWKRS